MSKVSDEQAAWEAFSSDFNNLSDEQVDDITRQEEGFLEQAEAWLEAVASWKAAGKPRRKSGEAK